MSSYTRQTQGNKMDKEGERQKADIYFPLMIGDLHKIETNSKEPEYLNLKNVKI